MQQTSIEAIERAALMLFAKHDFESVSVDDIAAAAGISRRTFFRYFASKNDIPFGNFGALLEDLEKWLASAPGDRPMFEVIADAVVRFNRLGSDGDVAHRERMRLVLQTPALRANAALRHAEWAAVVARYAASRLGVGEEDYGPRLVSHITLGIANAAYEQWLLEESSDLQELVSRGFAAVPFRAEAAVANPRRSGEQLTVSSG